MSSRLGVLVVCLLALSPAAALAGDEPAPPCPAPARPLPGVACWAVPSDTGRYVGYSVGGGCLVRGAEPGPDQGTWGWDYGGLLIHPHIRLLWCYCAHRRDVPAYRTTGTNVHGHSPSSP
jgi:hypothetical protein